MMRRLRMAPDAAATFAAAIFIATPASAQCGEDDPHCAVIPSRPGPSQRIPLHTKHGELDRAFMVDTIPVAMRCRTLGDGSCGVQGSGWMHDGTEVRELALTAAAFEDEADPFHG